MASCGARPSATCAASAAATTRRPTRCWAACTTARASADAAPLAPGDGRQHGAAGAGHRRRAAAADTGSDPYRVDAEGYAVGSPTGRRDRPGLRYAALPPAATVADYVDPDARVSREQHDRALAPEDARAAAGSTSDFDEYFDSGRRRLSRTRVPTSRRRRPPLPAAAPAAPCADTQAAVQERRRALIISQTLTRLNHEPRSRLLARSCRKTSTSSSKSHERRPGLARGRQGTGAIFVDRFMLTAMHYPCNYGYIPQTLSEDGDPPTCWS